MALQRALTYIVIGVMVLAMCHSEHYGHETEQWFVQKYQATMTTTTTTATTTAATTTKQTFRIFTKKKLTDVPTLTILYEALCPDSDSFIAQIGSIFDELKAFIHFEFVPFGLTKMLCRDAACLNTFFECRHGRIGCRENRLHDCALRHSMSEDQQLKFILCTMGPHKESADKCLQQLRYNLHDVDVCMNFDEGNKLQVKSYNRTSQHHPKTMPLVFVEDQSFEEYQEKASKDFGGFICFVLTKKLNLVNKQNAPSMCRTIDDFSPIRLLDS